MNLLYFDATQDWIHVSLASLEEGKPIKIIYELCEHSPKESSFRLVEEIQKALTSASVSKPDRIFVLVGPGSFTGIRITVTTARNLSQLWNIPCLGMDSVEAYSRYYHSLHGKRTVVCLDGKQNKYYFGTFSGIDPYTETVDAKQEYIEECLKGIDLTDAKFYHSGKIPGFFPSDSVKIEETLPKSMPMIEAVRSDLIRSSMEKNNYSSLLPNYIRGTYLETNKQ